MSVQFEEFLAGWTEQLTASGLRGFGRGRRTLDLADLDREVETLVEPAAGQPIESLHVTARLSFVWSALHTARAATVEEDVLVELLGRAVASRIGTERPWLRVDVGFVATRPWGQPLPMPTPERWAAWARESHARLGELEPAVADELEDDDGIGAWQGTPTARFSVDPGGALSLERLEIEAWQAILLPRTWDDPDRPTDPPPDAQLGRLFARVRQSLYAWGEVLDQLVPRPPV